jgi:D-3-phosphoglycerate dehydrogenase
MKKLLVTLMKKDETIVRSIITDFCLINDYEVNVIFNDIEMGQAELCETIKDIDGYIFGLEHITEKVLAAAKNLKVVCKHGAGIDNVDHQAARRHKVIVTNCPGLNSNSVAEVVIGLMIGLARQIPRCDTEMRQHIWNSFSGKEIAQKTLGIIGMGAIGKILAKYARAFNMNVLAYDLFQNEILAQKLGFQYVELAELIKAADFLSLHLPGDNSTKNLIDWEELNAMKPTAYLINTARGGVVNEDALYVALENGLIAGAAIDSFVNEPPFDSKLLTSNKIIALPHIGAATDEATARIIRYSLQNVRNVLEGIAPLSQVNYHENQG